MHKGVRGLLLLTLAGVVHASTVTVEAGAGAEQRLHKALAAAKPGDSIELGAGRFDFSAPLNLATAGMTLSGAGPAETELNFAQQPRVKDTLANTGIVVAADRLVLRDFAVVDAGGPGIAGMGVDRITFKNLRIQQTAGLRTAGSSNAIRLFASRHVLFDGLMIRHAWVSGIQISESENVVVRNCTFEENSTGLEVENDYFADVYNNTATHNAGGILVLDMPSYPHTGGHAIRIFHNKVVDNNTPTAAPGIASTMRTGTGILITGGESDIHIFDNDIGGNGHANVFLVALPWKIDNPDYNAVPNDVVIRNNRFGKSGFAPLDNLAAVKAAGGSLADVIWDGATSCIAAGQVKTFPPLRITIRDNVREDGMPVGFLSLGLTIADGGMLVADPTSKLPAEAQTSEPKAVQLPQDGSQSAERKE
jgi:parallel beta-helix repeat protein